MRRFLLILSALTFVASQVFAYERDPLDDSTLHHIDRSAEYDVFGTVRPFSDKDKAYFAQKWNSANISSEWHEYHGHLIRVDMLMSHRDLREMRLRFFHHQHDRYIDGDIPHILEQVASNVIRQTCGRQSSDVLRVYDRPSLEVSRPNAFYDYEIEAQGTSIREYGFRCIYPR
ncbi:MAG: hypothetical protein JW812_01695 [Alphaproteobacteria bacterium]|nr:hypothetical protein [Alphaproteobacteria bacterium]MBN2779965.1 hypothetical protein [Alphaproteobacteria bacterium]